MFHVELAPLGGIFGPLKSDLGVFWPFRGTDFIMGKKTKFFDEPLVRKKHFWFLAIIKSVPQKGQNTT